MIFLTSNGITSDGIFNRLQQSLKEDAEKAALITTASVGYKDKDGNIPRHTEALERLGWKSILFAGQDAESKLRRFVFKVWERKDSYRS